MSSWFLVEEDHPDLNFSGKQVVALTPWAAASFKTRDQPYSILEDYYSEKEMRRQEDAFFSKQLHWLDRFDLFLQERLAPARERNWKLASVHCNRFKYLIDSFLIRAYVVEEFFKKVKPTQILLVATPETSQPVANLYEFNRYDRISYGIFIEQAAQKYKVSFELKKNLSKTGVSPIKKTTSVPTFFKHCRNFLRYQKWKAGKRSQPSRFLFLDSGIKTLDNLSVDLMTRGHQVFVKTGDSVHLLNHFSEPQALHDSLSIDEKQCNAIARDFFNSKLWKELENQIGLSILSWLEPYFENFFQSELPRVLNQALSLDDFFSNQSINAVVARASVGENYPAALLSAESSKVPRVCLQHSTGPGDLKDWAFDELAFFDINFALTRNSADYFNAQTISTPLYRHCQVFESSHHFAELKRQYHSAPQARARILYCPAKLAKGMSHFNTMFYPMTWYFEHQTRVLSLLAAQPNFEIIYKHTEGQNWADRSILPWLEKQNFSNVKICKGAFTEFLPQAERVLFDYPSTGLFETAACEVPVLALYHEAMSIWPPMLPFFGKSLQSFASTEQALTKIKEFLNAPAETYKASMVFSDINLVSKLESLLSSKEAHVEA